MSNPVKIAIHKPTNKIVHINTIDPSDKQARRSCYCLKCDEKLQAVLDFKDIDRKKFFRHDNDSDCKGAQETALHELAKQILVEHSYIVTKRYGKIVFTEAVSEKKLEQIRPDITAIHNGQEIYIEVFVSHAVDQGKAKFFFDKKYRSIEIDLSTYYKAGIEDVDEIKRWVLDDTDNKKIIYWANDEQLIKQDETNDILANLWIYIKKHQKVFGVLGIIVLLSHICKKRKF